MKNAKRIAVIGAGAAGLASLKELTSAGYDVVAFERRDRLGGLWNSAYDALHLITPRSTSQFDGAPHSPDAPDFPSRDQVVEYFHAFAEQHGLEPKIRFSTEVLDLLPSDDLGLQGWNVVTADGVERFDAVVVANGHLHHKFDPGIASAFTGKVAHSSEYRNADDIVGDRVLVVGAGNSGCDLATDAANARKRVDIAIRHPFTFLPKTLFGRPRAELFFANWPPRVQERFLRFFVRVAVGRPDSYRGLPVPTSRNLNKQRAIVNTLLPYWISHGRIAVRPGIRSIDGRTVTYTDGSASDYDTILLATGFRYDAPFLASAVRFENDMPHRWAAGILPDRTANLYFVGLIAPVGAQWPIYSHQARLVVTMLDLQSRSSGPIVKAFQKDDEGFGGLELPRPTWYAMAEQVEKVLRRLHATLPPDEAGRKHINQLEKEATA